MSFRFNVGPAPITELQRVDALLVAAQIAGNAGAQQIAAATSGVSTCVSDIIVSVTGTVSTPPRVTVYDSDKTYMDVTLNFVSSGGFLNRAFTRPIKQVNQNKTLSINVVTDAAVKVDIDVYGWQE